MRVSVIGGSSVPAETAAVAEELGERLANRGHTVVCGGLGGVMAAVCRGAANAGGETIGVLPTGRCEDANPHVTTPIATGMGHARNALVVMNGDAAIAVDGSHGTLSRSGWRSHTGGRSPGSTRTTSRAWRRSRRRRGRSTTSRTLSEGNKRNHGRSTGGAGGVPRGSTPRRFTRCRGTCRTRSSRAASRRSRPRTRRGSTSACGTGGRRQS